MFGSVSDLGQGEKHVQMMPCRCLFSGIFKVEISRYPEFGAKTCQGEMKNTLADNKARKKIQLIQYFELSEFQLNGGACHCAKSYFWLCQDLHTRSNGCSTAGMETVN